MVALTDLREADAYFRPLFRSGLIQLIRQILLILSDKFLLWRKVYRIASGGTWGASTRNSEEP
jgi:hypothetical protein